MTYDSDSSRIKISVPPKEETQTTDRLHIRPHERALDFTQLPITVDAAKQTVEEYKALITHLPDSWSAEVRSDLDNQRIKNCFSGISPEVGANNGGILGELNDKQLLELRQLFAHYCPDMHFMILPKGRISLMNFLAVENTIRINKICFPKEASLNSRQWIMGHVSEWLPSREAAPLVELRYGLLSGFPLTDSALFPKYEEALSDLAESATNNIQRQALQDISKLEAKDSLNTEDQRQYKLLIARVNPAFPVNKINLLLQRRTIYSPELNISFVSFSDQGNRYLDDIKEIAKRSGMK